MSGRGRSAVRVVARREFVERIRDRGFLISTAITLLILVAFIGASAFLARGSRFDLGLVGQASNAVGAAVVSASADLDIEVTLERYANEDEARRAVREGEVDVALVDAASMLVRTEPPVELVGVIQAVSLRERSEVALGDAGLTPAEIDAALEQPALPVTALEPLDRREREYAAVGFIAVLALYGQLFAYGYWVAAGVVEEKASRVVEVLLATVRPSQLLRGKILGIGLLGLLQLSMIGTIGFAASQALGALRFPAGALAAIGIVLIWFVLGYFFYSTLFAVAGSIVPRQEDLQATMTPLSIVIVASLFLGIQANQDPASTLAFVTSLLPPSAPLVMPSRLLLGEASVWEGIASAAISIGATLALIRVATRVYARAALRTGRVRIRQILRAERRS